ncbi:hypothetical protein [uncultured Roseobacter sp.]|uniref:hypothetical protein n=1 Tax=uncultured Roseobacter sp. TaxID=114847 RepID=UPI00262E90C3|nr:hypothetical protein [uncultured Roseobacter sp.]
MIADLFDQIDLIEEPGPADVPILLSSSEISAFEARPMRSLSDFAETLGQKGVGVALRESSTSLIAICEQLTAIMPQKNELRWNELRVFTVKPGMDNRVGGQCSSSVFNPTERRNHE